MSEIIDFPSLHYPSHVVRFVVDGRKRMRGKPNATFSAVELIHMAAEGALHLPGYIELDGEG